MDKKIKIIIADDIAKIAETNKNIVMKNENVEVVGIAYNGKEELDMILELNPDLVITDNKMPIMNGIEVVEEIYKLQSENKPDFILVTSDFNFELNNKCRELEVFGIVNKLSATNSLLDTINEYILYKSEMNNNMDSLNSIKENNLKNGFFQKILQKVKRGT